MANDFLDITPKLLAGGLLALRQNAMTVRLVNRRYEEMAGEYGSTIDVPISSAIASQDVVPDNVPPSTADMAINTVPIPLDQWREAPFYLTDQDVLQINKNNLLPMQASEAVKSLANYVDNTVLGLYPEFYGIQGEGGTTPFGTGTTTDANQLRKILNVQLAPVGDRYAVLDPEAEANALEIRAFQDASWNGSIEGIQSGLLKQKLGFLWYMNQNIPSHSAGAADGDYTVNGAHTVGDDTVAVTGGTGAFNRGDIITFAGDPQTYTVLVTSVAPATTLTIRPALRVAKSGGEAITPFGDHVVNLGFHRDAIAFASRPLPRHGSQLGVINLSAVDPISGLALRIEVTHEHKRVRYSYDILFGCAVIRPEFGARLAG